MSTKQWLKNILKKIPVAFTRNQKYDRQTMRVIRKVCKTNSNCIDVGCHKGEVLDAILKSAPEGKHFAFEPLPELFRELQEKYRGTNCTVSQVAVTNQKAQLPFNYVTTNPSYSGLRKRKYDRRNEKEMEIIVNADTLDNLVPLETKIDFIKIDVEGAELFVLQGAEKLIKKNKPVIVFEYGLGGSDYYEPDPGKIFSLINEYGYRVSLLHRWLKSENPLSMEDFKKQYYGKLNYFFIAYPQNE